MPVVKRKDKRRHGWDAEDRLHLLHGCSYFGTLAGCGEFGRFSDLPKNQARAKLVREAWDDLGEELTKQYVANYPGCRPWAWWQFDAPEQPRDDETGLDYLRRLNLLYPGELDRALVVEERRAASEPGDHSAFRVDDPYIIHPRGNE